MAARIKQVIAIRGPAFEWSRLKPGRDGWVPDAAGRETAGQEPDLLAALQSAPASADAAAGAVARQLAGRRAALVLPASCAMQRVITLPSADPAEIAGMVELQLDALCPFPAESVIYSFEILQAGPDASRVLVAAVQKKILEAAGAPFRRRGVAFSRVTLSTPSWWDILAARRVPLATGRQLLLIASASCCEWIVVDSGAPLLFRALALAPGMAPADFAGDIAQETAYSLTSLALEYGDAPLDAVTLFADADAPRGLADALRAALATNVRVEPAPGSLTEGVARREGEPGAPRLDLTPPEWRAEEERRAFQRGLLRASAALFIIWAAGVTALAGWTRLHGTRLDRLERDLAAVQGPAREIRDLVNRVDALSRYTDTTYSALECLREIADLMPPGVELRQYKFEKGKAITLSGEAPASQPVYDFKKALDASELFRFSKKLENPTRIGNRENFRMAIALREDIE